MGESIGLCHGSGTILGDGDAAVDEVVVRRSQGGEVGRGLLVAALGERPAGVHRQTRDRDHDRERQREDREHLAGRPPVMPGSALATAGHWISELLEDVRVSGPSIVRTGSDGWNTAVTLTRTQSAG